MKLTERVKKNLGTAAFLIAGLGVFWLSGHSIDLPKLPQENALFFLNTTASLPQGLYMRIPNWFLRDGDYVAYVPTKETAEVAVSRGWLQINGLLLKKIGATPGEGYDINPSTMQFSVQGRYLGQVSAEDREGNAMPVHYGKHVVPSGEFLPVGTSPRSFDGRYTGTVPMHHIRAKVIPVVTIR